MSCSNLTCFLACIQGQVPFSFSIPQSCFWIVVFRSWILKSWMWLQIHMECTTPSVHKYNSFCPDVTHSNTTNRLSVQIVVFRMYHIQPKIHIYIYIYGQSEYIILLAIVLEHHHSKIHLPSRNPLVFILQGLFMQISTMPFF